MQVIGIDVDRSGRLWLSDGTTIYSKNPYYIYLSLKRYIENNNITHICIEDKDLWSFEFRQQQGKLIAILTMISQKKDILNCTVIKVDSRETSITCSKCGVSSRLSRKTKSLFECIMCGYRTNADRNAAVNILNKGLSIKC